MLMMVLEVEALVQPVKLETRNLIPVVAALVVAALVVAALVVAALVVVFDERGK